MFTKGFDKFVCVDESITCEVDGFTVVARIEHDCHASIDDTDCFPEEYREEIFGEDTPENRAHFETALTARRAWERDEWHYCGVVLSVSRDGVELDGHAASLWGIERNYPGSDNSYLLEVANELLPEALNVARDKFASLSTNARLIAAAPVLLEACKLAHARLTAMALDGHAALVPTLQVLGDAIEAATHE